MSDLSVQAAAAAAPGLTQWQRVTNTFFAPSKTFEDIKRGNQSWWLPFLITILTGAFLYGAITRQVTWKTVYDNQQRAAPQWARNMIDQLPADRRAQAERRGPVNQEVTWALSPLGLLLMDAIAALVLWPTINFGFGGKARFGAILAVTLYAGLVLWPIKFLLGGIALFAGALPEGFNIGNVAGTNIGYYLSQQDTSRVVYILATAIDALVIWSLVLTSMGVAAVAGVKRSAGYIAVFGWWILLLLVSIGFAAI